MGFKDYILRFFHLTFAFSVPSVTITTVAVYLAILVSNVVVYESVPAAPSSSSQAGLDLSQAFRDLQTIAAVPHPYNSHANDAVRSHILARIQAMADTHRTIQYVNDINANGTFSASLFGKGGVYFEGNNILVKIPGREPELEAVLFSAHFDSVSTAPGATDDGMGIATLLQLVEYFAKNTPKRTVVFNFNNAEEDGLYGAIMFMEHSWSALPKLFLNLEGAASGGRPLLFRTSSTAVTRAFTNVPHPHGSVLSSDAFKRGLVKSGTDYQVYEKMGLQGLDLAFYRRRSLYHTRDDSVPSLQGRNALWAMMETALFSGIELTENTPVAESVDDAVYFDLYGEALAVASLKTFFIIHVVFLVVGPLLVAASVAVLQAKGKLYWSGRGWVRFPVSIILGFAGTFAFAALIEHVNPFIVYSSGYVVAACLIALAGVIMFVPLAGLATWHPVPQQKSIILLENYVFWWILLVVDTVLINKYSIGGLYIVTFFHIAAFASLVASFLELLWLPASHDSYRVTAGVENEGRIPHEEDHSAHEEQTEETPLLGRQTVGKADDIIEGGYHGFWIIQYLLAVPFPTILTCGILVVVLGALPQTLSDGSSSRTVLYLLAFLSWLMIFPLSSFYHKVHRHVIWTLLTIFIITGVYVLLAFPFSSSSPMKVFFYQAIDLDTRMNTVNLTGLATYVDQKIIPDLPSTWNETVSCRDGERIAGLRTCQWAGLAPAISASTNDEWLVSNATLVGPGLATISIRGTNTRECRIYFDDAVTSVRVDNSTGEVMSEWPFPPEGIRSLQLWSRTWDREFAVTATWTGRESLSGRISCGWAELSQGQLPAFVEAAGFIPDWTRLTKADSMLLEVTRKFNV